MVYDSESDRIVLIGGQLGDLTVNPDAYSGATWTYDVAGNKWTLMEPAANPGSLSKVALSYSDASDRVVLFGGLRSFPHQEYTDATWAYDYNSDTWEEMKPQR